MDWLTTNGIKASESIQYIFSHKVELRKETRGHAGSRDCSTLSIPPHASLKEMVGYAHSTNHTSCKLMLKEVNLWFLTPKKIKLFISLIIVKIFLNGDSQLSKLLAAPITVCTVIMENLRQYSELKLFIQLHPGTAV